LPYNAKIEEIERHFRTAGGITSVRLLTDKITKKPKGFAFMEFDNTDSFQKALMFHHTMFKGRQINVELTAGGGGKGDNRKQKLKEKNEGLEAMRVSSKTGNLRWHDI
jgi:nucleolar protein 6